MPKAPGKKFAFFSTILQVLLYKAVTSENIFVISGHFPIHALFTYLTVIAFSAISV